MWGVMCHGSSSWWPPSELSDDTACVAAGIAPDLEKYRYVLKMNNTYDNSYGGTMFAPLFSSSSLDDDGAADGSITLAAIFIHGLAGDANTYFCDAMKSVAAEGLSKNVLVISPWFGDSQATGTDWNASASSSWQSTYWTASRWVSGGNASPSPSRYTTAFDVLDTVVQKLGSAKFSGRFPNLQRVAINGFSAGAQMASRWAIFSSYGNGDADPGIQVRTVVADGSSYVYLDKTRPASSCIPGEDTGKSHSCSTFEEPDSSLCTGYNAWKYGLDLTDLSANLYLEPFQANQTLVTAAVKAFLSTADMRFIFGDEDVCNCNTDGYSNTQSTVCYPSGTSCSPNNYGGQLNGVNCCDTYPDTTTDNALNTGCESSLMGTNRLQRGINYMYYLNTMRNASVNYGFFAGGHNNSAFYASGLFKAWVYGQG